jgi:F-type H+-transporting ATPase subunit epsilon
VAELSFEIVTPEGFSFHADVYEIILPTTQGFIGILPHHIPLISLATPGVIALRKRQGDRDEEREYIACAGGFVEIDGRRVRLLSDSAERAEDVDELKAKEALEAAQHAKETAKDQVTLADALSAVEHATARLKIAEIKRRRNPRA